MQSVNEMRMNPFETFTICHLLVVLTIKLEEKWRICYQYAVILHSIIIKV